jgi:3'(2'), 5'-bisphosphate nucleotidase
VSADDHILARDLAAEAGRRLVALRARGGEPDLLRKAGDRLGHEFLTEALAAARPGDVVLSEEGADDPARLSAARVWIVDPLDGTREFGEAARTDWAVHVALWERDPDGTPGPDVARGPDGTSGPDAARGPDGTPGRDGTPGPDAARGPDGILGRLTAGAVALPAQDRVLSTVDPVAPPPPEADAPVRIVVSRTRAPRFVRDISDLTGAELVPMGSAGAKVAAVVLGQADAYLHGGGFYEWDTAAPVAVARAAGLHASRIDGSPLRYNQPQLLMPDILVCRPALANNLLQAIREVTDAH